MSKEVSKPAAFGIVIVAALLISGAGWFLINRASGPGGSDGKPADLSKMPAGLMPTMQVQGSNIGDTRGARIQPLPGGMGMPPGMAGNGPGVRANGPPMSAGMGGGMPGAPPGGMGGGMPSAPPGGGAPMPGGMTPTQMPKIGPDGKPELPAGAPADTVVKHVDNPFSKK